LSEIEGVVKGGFWLFLDHVVVSVAGWLFWFLATYFTTTTEIGYASTVLRLVGLAVSFMGLGLDYSLLKEIKKAGATVFTSILAFELSLLLIASPLVFIIGINLYGTNLNLLMGLGILLMLINGLQLVSWNTTLGLLQSQIVFKYDSLAAILRLPLIVLLLTQGLGALGLITATLVQQIITVAGLMWFCHRKVGFGFINLKKLRDLLKTGLSNFPGKISRITINNLSIVLLAAATSNPSTVGIFSIVMAMSLLLGSLSSSFATMALPTSTIHGTDTTATSLRLGLFLTAPAISVLVTTPKLILSLVGKVYTTASTSLTILALAAIPTALVLNAIAKLNHKAMHKQLIYLGALQLTTFLATFLVTAQAYQELGAALAILTSSAATGLLSFKWLGKTAIKPTILALTTVTIGWAAGTLLTRFSTPLAFATALTTSTLTIFALKGITVKELKQILKSIK